jgi:hypothetical protein
MRTRWPSHYRANNIIEYAWICFHVSIESIGFKHDTPVKDK